MDEGIVMLGEQKIGTFCIALGDQVIITLDNGKDVRSILEYASDNGMTVNLQMTPVFEELPT